MRGLTHPPYGAFTLNLQSLQAAGLAVWYPALGTHFLRDRSLWGLGNGGIWRGVATAATHPLFNTVYDFTGGAGWIEPPETAATALDYGTLSAWAWFNNTGVREVVIWKNYVADNDGGFAIRKETTDTIKFHFRIGDVENLLNPADVVSMQTWYHIALTYDGAYARGYLNGRLIGTSANVPGVLDKSTQSAYGLGAKKVDGFDQIQGYIADPRIYNRALTAPEIWQLYNPATRWDLYAPLQRYWLVSAPAAPAATISPLSMYYFRQRRAG